jgi:hypothetical protein
MLKRTKSQEKKLDLKKEIDAPNITKLDDNDERLATAKVYNVISPARNNAANAKKVNFALFIFLCGEYFDFTSHKLFDSVNN